MTVENLTSVMPISNVHIPPGKVYVDDFLFIMSRIRVTAMSHSIDITN